jgi:hypothetical protein
MRGFAISPLEDCGRPRKKARVAFLQSKSKIKKSKNPAGTLEETLIHMEDPPKWLFLLEEGRFRRSKFSISVRFGSSGYMNCLMLNRKIANA